MYILGRIDDVINISGHRLSTIEILSRPLVTHPAVLRLVSAPVEDELTGHQAVAYVTLTDEGKAPDRG